MIQVKKTRHTKWYYYAHEWYTKKMLYKLDERHPSVTFTSLGERLTRAENNKAGPELDTIGKILTTKAKVRGGYKPPAEQPKIEDDEFFMMMSLMKPGSLAHTA